MNNPVNDTADLVKELREDNPDADILGLLDRAAAALEAAQAREKKLEAELASAQQSNENWMNRCLAAGEVADNLGEMSRQFANELIAAEASLAAANERVKELEGALKPFAAKADLYEANHPTSRHPLRDATQITHRLGDFRAARTALKTAARKE